MKFRGQKAYRRLRRTIGPRARPNSAPDWDEDEFLELIGPGDQKAENQQFELVLPWAASP
jgi:hypothetical protein